MGHDQAVVHVVDDDEAMRDALVGLLGSVGLKAESYASATDFLGKYDPDMPGCIILDVRMPGMDGLVLQQKLKSDHVTLPIVFLTGHGDVSMAVHAIQEGAFDFIEKPFRETHLLEAVNRAIEEDLIRREEYASRTQVESKLSTLTNREREVLDMVVAGKNSKAIAEELGLSPKTVDAHRARILDKMSAQKAVQLVRMLADAKVE